MIQIVAIVSFFALIYLVWKKPEYGILSTLILTAFSPIFDSVVSSSIRLGGIFFIFVIEFLFVQKIKQKKFKSLYLFFCIAIAKEILGYVFTGSTQGFVLSMYVYVIILGIAYFTYQVIRFKGVSFLNQYKIYIVLCLAVQFYRTLFDFTFMGYVTLGHEGAQYADLYTYGGELFRPSSLQGCIVYAIELAIFIAFLILKEGINRRNMLLLLLSVVGLFLTFSRSGLAIMAATLMYYMIKNKKYVASIALAGAFIGLLFLFNYSDRLAEAFDFTSDTYNTRLGSIDTVSKIINEFDLSQYVFGLGYGSANYAGEDSQFKYYVENFYLSNVINSGIITLLLFIWYSLKNLFNGLKKNMSSSFILFCLLGVNFMACSLAAYTIQILFWLICFTIMYPSSTILNENERFNTVKG